MQPQRKNISFIEFQAVVLTHPLGNLFPLADQNEASSLLPVANRPLLCFQLELLCRAGFEEVTVVAIRAHAEEIRKYLESTPEETEEWRGLLKVSLQVVDDTADTCEALRKIKDSLKKNCDLVIVPGDLITDVNFAYMADIHRTYDATLTTLMQREEVKKDDKKKKKSSDDLVYSFYAGLASENHTRHGGAGVSDSQRLVFFRSTADVEGDSVGMSKQLLRRFPQVTLSRRLTDSHVYFLAHWVLDMLEEKELAHLASLQGELIPYLVSSQFTQSQHIKKHAQAQRHRTTAYEMSSAPGSSQMAKDTVRCFAYTAPPSNFCMRATTVESYAAMNSHVAFGAASRTQPAWRPIAETNRVMQHEKELKSGVFKAQKCVMAQDVRVGNKCVFKNSVIGAHCRIGDGVRLTNSVIMDFVTVEKGCTINDCTVSAHAKILEQSTLDRCRVGRSRVVEREGFHQNEDLAADTDGWTTDLPSVTE